ncbi:class II fructose-bisphosphate aldolase [Mycobacterium sp. 236(2023)]|uniref:class II fructose-bisphosphate aldolase n=1 Tax=Mycobacterium sp. 236(2023) TaxID=3038163 RepID=UPI0024152651|nr:class II fructose-bisphosphate aldolase [Mycobacterium sp. 236(2023)]MDG4666544.1 class II fructose-bisphosphate aldolase [Mycobacterium sp. 236(2023)]
MTSDLVAAAAGAGGAVLAFNVITIEHAEGIAEGVETAGGAAILQISENTIAFHGRRIAPLLAACAQIAAQSNAPLGIHLDHLQDMALVDQAVASAAALGATSLMIDAAHLDYDANVERTRAVTAQAHAAGLWVEAELGEIGGKAGAHAAGTRTDPDEAAAFVAATGVDALAVAVGSSHAMTTREAQLDHDLIHRLAESVEVPLVLHGSSGVSDDQLRRAAEAGIRKLNVGTALNIAFTGGVRKVLADNEESSDPRPYLAAGRAAVSDTVADLCRVVAAAPAGKAAPR